ncbi:DNA-binding protein [Pseudomonas putida]|uniref:DNA-binding protein n=1 Tax=Pseudomonas putida TaxID=303 RepID=UPI0018ABE3E4|nr:DNA-binding protein [Pseudomonas putida]MBF8766025.1 DNA-binding protein [Pseudomonas putida]
MADLDAEIQSRLADMGVTPLLGGLIPERAAADLLGYSHAYMRQQAARGLAPLPYVLRGNRRFYRVDDIRAFVSQCA